MCRRRAKVLSIPRSRPTVPMFSFMPVAPRMASCRNLRTSPVEPKITLLGLTVIPLACNCCTTKMAAKDPVVWQRERGPWRCRLRPSTKLSMVAGKNVHASPARCGRGSSSSMQRSADILQGWKGEAGPPRRCRPWSAPNEGQSAPAKPGTKAKGDNHAVRQTGQRGATEENHKTLWHQRELQQQSALSSVPPQL